MSSRDRRDAIKYQNVQAKRGGKIPSMAESIAAVYAKRASDALDKPTVMSRKQKNENK